MVLFGFQFYPVGYFGKFINFGLGTVKSERVNNESRYGGKCIVLTKDIESSK